MRGKSEFVGIFMRPQNKKMIAQTPPYRMNTVNLLNNPIFCHIFLFPWRCLLRAFLLQMKIKII